jgi:hypothetical protein
MRANAHLGNIGMHPYGNDRMARLFKEKPESFLVSLASLGTDLSELDSFKDLPKHLSQVTSSGSRTGNNNTSRYDIYSSQNLNYPSVSMMDNSEEEAEELELEVTQEEMRTKKQTDINELVGLLKIMMKLLSPDKNGNTLLPEQRIHKSKVAELIKKLHTVQSM